jgi:hypothetical protein
MTILNNSTLKLPPGVYKKKSHSQKLMLRGQVEDLQTPPAALIIVFELCIGFLHVLTQCLQQLSKNRKRNYGKIN